MKEVLMFLKADCPFCHEALAMMDDLFRETPKFKDVPLRKIDEDREAELANTYDYYYVPTFYVGGEKLHEGIPNIDAVREVFDRACEQ